MNSLPPSSPGWLDSLDGPAWLVGADDLRVQAANAAAARWLGRGSPAALAGMAAQEVLPSLEDLAFWTERADHRDGAHPGLDSTVELPHPDGGLAQVERRIAAVGQPHQAWLVQLRDVSATHRAQQERDTLLAELRATLEATADGILVTDLRGRIRAFNQRFATLWSLPEHTLAGRDDQSVFDWMRLCVLDPDAYQQRLEEVQGQLMLRATDTLTLLDGTVLERHSQPQWSAGRPIGRVHCFRPVAHRRPGTVRVPEAADGREGHQELPNRSGFLAATGRAIERARREGQVTAVVCVAFDPHALFALDGHAAARHVQDLLQLLRAQVREPHLIGRLGGARLGVLLRDAGQAAAEALARRLLEASRLAPADTPALSVGVATYPQAGLDAPRLLACAEQAADTAWHADDGPGWCSSVHGELAEPASQQQRLQHLRDCVAQGQMDRSFRLRYLPRHDARSGRLVAVEALLRWQEDSDGPELQPAQFLPMAERHGLHDTLDAWVLEHSIQQAARWRAAGLELRINVNACGAALAQPGYARRVAAVLESAGWPADLLEIDVTEHALNVEPEAALANLQALRSLGVRVVLDDFGSGEAGLGLLTRFPLSAVKIDRRLLAGRHRAGQEQALVLALAQMARALQLEVLAEGVETEAQRQSMADAGCSAWQGYLGSAPTDARGIERQARRPIGLRAANDEPLNPSPLRRPA